MAIKDDLFFVGILGIAGYAAWRYFKPSVDKATGGASTGIANAYVGVTNWLFGSSDIVPTGNVILPNGQKVPMAQLHVTWDSDAGVASFVYQGYGYIIRPNPNGGPGYDTRGDYHAE